MLLDREWLLSNGTGAYAAGTAAGCHTRRYHGLLIATTRPPVGRIVGLSQVCEQLVLSREAGAGATPGGPVRQVLDFATCMFRDIDNDEQRVMSPNGMAMIKQFARGLHVQWTYKWGKITLAKKLFLHWKQQAATLHYQVTGLEHMQSSATLRLTPMLTLRDFHGLLHQGESPPIKIKTSGKNVTATLEDVAVTFCCDAPTGKVKFTKKEEWWHNIYYPIEAQRGQDDHEDYYLPGSFTIELPAGCASMEAMLTAALGAKPAAHVTDTTARAAHLKAVCKKLEPVAAAGEEDEDGENMQRCLAIATDDFVVDRVMGKKKLQTIVAGYPWFADWGRDSFIALPGLLLTTGRYGQARSVLQAFAGAIKDGLVPNRFDDYDDGAAHYNTVDASLWFVHAAAQYVAASGDTQAWEDWLADASVSIVDAYIRGTHHDIVMAGDCLISAGSATTQLTWMDAACGEPGTSDRVVFTPRHGKAVEINALWYNALATLAQSLPKSYADKADHYHKLTGRVKRSFGGVFWRDDLECLVDRVWTDEQGDRHPDYALRPNQIFAASLPYSPLPRTRQLKVVAAVRQYLLTPVGLRTLAEDDPHYHGYYSGGPLARDEAYHQGTIWPWLIGPYAEAVLRSGRFSSKAQADARLAIAPLVERLLGPGLGHLHEIHEAAIGPDGSHRPVGCFAQAWSVAEVVRVLDLLSGD
jgi:predicted glycogen debranching enzyme